VKVDEDGRGKVSLRAKAPEDAKRTQAPERNTIFRGGGIFILYERIIVGQPAVRQPQKDAIGMTEARRIHANRVNRTKRRFV
jgi:hypothetical protein